MTRMTLSGNESLSFIIVVALIAVAGLQFWSHLPFYWLWIVLALTILGSTSNRFFRIVIGLVMFAAAGLQIWLHRPFYWVWIIPAVALTGNAFFRLFFRWFSRTLSPAAQILVFSIAVQGFYLLTASYFIPDGAVDFIRYASALMHWQSVSAANGPTSAACCGPVAREIGYPLLLILSGIYVTGSLIGITIIQSVMAVWIPVMVYWTLAHASELWAYRVGMFSVVSLAPLLFVKWLHHDQAYVFFTVVDAWLFTRFVVTGRPRDLYWLTAALIATSFTRPAGVLLFPPLLAVAYLVRRGPLKPYAVSILIFLVATVAYQFQRYEMFDKGQADPPSYTGQQIFYNFYINAGEYGIALGPELGPNMRAITETVRADMQPDPSHSAALAAFVAMDQMPRPFYEKYFLPFSADELVERIYRVPNWEYFYMMCELVNSDRLFLGASWEIFKAHPLYALQFTLRNAWYFLYNPGWVHGRFSVSPFFQSVRYFPPDPVGGFPGAFVDELVSMYPWDPIFTAAKREAKFDNLGALPNVVRHLYAAIRIAWLSAYHPMVLVLFWLTIAAWLSVLIHWASAFRWSWSVRLRNAIGTADIYGPILGTSTILMYNVVVTCAFAEPDYRYHDMILLNRIVLAGFGAVACSRAMQTTFATVARRKLPIHPTNISSADMSAIELRGAWLLLGLMCAGWAWYLVLHSV
jgi:hypothetical protein